MPPFLAKPADKLSRTGHFFLRISRGDSLLRFVNVQYVLLCGNPDTSMPQLWRVRPNGCELTDRSAAGANRNVDPKSEDTYLVYHIDPAGHETDQCNWSPQQLAAIGIVEDSAEPVVLSLERLWGAVASPNRNLP